MDEERNLTRLAIPAKAAFAEELTEQCIADLSNEAILLLKQLIATPSVSGNEQKTADILQQFLNSHGIKTHRLHNNVWAYNQFYNTGKPTILLNSHHDTAKPSTGYSRDPYYPEIIDNKLYGLGSNDSGGSLVSLLSAFIYFYTRPDMSYNLCFAASAEEENSGPKGIKTILTEIGKIDFAIIGEPTELNMATSEMGCMVLDCSTSGLAAHAARNDGDNALYKALADIQWFSTYQFPRQSGFMGPIKMTVTEIRAGVQHNIVPDDCQFTVDVRLSDCYAVEDVLRIIKENTRCEITPRPGIIRPSSIDHIHPLVMAGVVLGLKSYISPVSSDQGWLDVPSLMIGPGDATRSHAPNEYIFVDEIKEGIATYIKLLESLLYCLINKPHLINLS